MKNKINVTNHGKYRFNAKPYLASVKEHTKLMGKLADSMKKSREAEELKMAKPERAILKMVGGWTVAEIERLLIIRVMGKVKGRAKWPNASNSATGDRGASPAKADGKA